MKNLNQLWTQRLNLLIKEIGKYGRLVFNDHFSVILFVILGFFMFFYREQLIVLNSGNQQNYSLPILIFSALLLGLMSIYGRPLWLMKAADRSYVYPRGSEWLRYWLKGSFIGLALPVIINVIIATLVFPFVANGFLFSGSAIYLWIGMQLLAVLLVQMQTFARIFSLKTVDKLPFALLYSMILALFIGLLGSVGLFTMVIFLLGLISGYGYFIYLNRHQWLDFEYVVETDLERTNVFYKWIGFFADVPAMQVVVKRRPYLDGIIQRLSGDTKNRDYYLFVRLLFRNTAYSGIWLRVLIFISVMLLLTDNLYLVLGLGLIGFYLTLVQILPMVNHYDGNPFQHIYPKSQKRSASALQRVSFIILSIQWLVFSLSAWVTMGISLESLIVSILWLLLIILLIYLYIPFWLHKQA